MMSTEVVEAPVADPDSLRCDPRGVRYLSWHRQTVISAVDNTNSQLANEFPVAFKELQCIEECEIPQIVLINEEVPLQRTFTGPPEQSCVVS